MKYEAKEKASLKAEEEARFSEVFSLKAEEEDQADFNTEEQTRLADEFIIKAQDGGFYGAGWDM